MHSMCNIIYSPTSHCPCTVCRRNTMKNAKKEFQDLLLQVSTITQVRCATITHYKPYLNDAKPKPQPKTFNLQILYTKKEADEFLDWLDFEYDSGYGIQEIYGTIWFEDKTWATREEYDGSEWWEYHEQPEIPNHLYKMT